MAEWTFLTTHGRALVLIAQDPGIRLRDIAAALTVTERRAYGVVNDLVQSGYVAKEREGRRNRYQIQRHLPLPEATVTERAVGDVLQVLVGPARSRRMAARTKR